MAVKNSIPSTLVHKSESLELLTVEISLSPKTLLVCLYIPPNCSLDYHTSLLQYISNIRSISEVNTFVLGDFNAPDVNRNTQHASFLCNTLHNFSQLIDFPTHVRGNTLDLIFTNVPQRVTHVCICDSPILKSDHYIISVDILPRSHTTCRNSVTVGNKSVMSQLNYRKADLLLLATCLCDALDSIALPNHAHNDIHGLWDQLRNAILLTCTRCVPRFRFPSRLSPRWFDSNIRHSLNKTRSLRKRIKRNILQLF